MKKVSRQKLALAAETIRSLTPANLGTVAGGLIVVVTSTTNTTHSIIMVCNPPTITVSSAGTGTLSDG
jgi:dethiobiotin synthetase